MKKLYIFATFCLLAINSFGQTFLYENFNTYDGTSATVPLGWFFSKNANYTSSASSGPSTPNSYKFGINGAYIVSPQLVAGDSISFYMKLNGSGNDSIDTLSVLNVYISTTDTVSQNFTLLQSYSKIASVMKRYAMPRNNAAFVKIAYTKVGGNIAFDDFAVYSGTFVAVKVLNPAAKPSINILQNENILSVNVINSTQAAKYSLVDITGKTIKSGLIGISDIEEISIQNCSPGIYFMVVSNQECNTTRKIVLD